MAQTLDNTMTHSQNNTSEKPDLTQQESVSDNAGKGHDEHDETVAEGLVKSPLDKLSVARTLWVFRRVALVAISVYTGYVCEGFELKAGNSSVANAGFIKQFGTVSLLSLISAIAWTHSNRDRFAEKFGRKPAFYIAWVWLVAGCLFLNFAKTPAVWALGKLCNGAGVGVLQIVCQIYIMEICPNKIRGGMITFQAVWSNIGTIVSSVMMQRLNKNHPDNYILAVRILWAPVGLMILCWVIVPESPWYYARRGDKDKAMKSMRKLYGNVEGYDYEQEYGIIATTIAHEKDFLAEEPKYIHLFQGVNLKRTLTVMLFSANGQFGGITIINTYSTYFFALTGLSDPFLGTLIISCCNLLAVILWALTTDSLGRRTIINASQIAVCVSLFVVGGLWWSGATHGNKAAGTALLVICCLWSATFQVISMAYYVMAAEIPAALLRVKTGPVAFSIQSILGIATGYATPPMLLSLNLKSGFVYGAFTVPITIAMLFLVPETKGRSAAEIDELYERKIPVWKWSKTVTHAEEQMHATLTKSGLEETKIEV